MVLNTQFVCDGHELEKSGTAWPLMFWIHDYGLAFDVLNTQFVCGARIDRHGHELEKSGTAWPLMF